MVISTKSSSTSMDAQVVFEEMSQRYITTAAATTTHFVRPFILGSDVEVLEVTGRHLFS
jgi:hypothetical protein